MSDVDILFIIFSLPAGLHAKEATLDGLNPYLSSLSTPTHLRASLASLEERSMVHTEIVGRYDDKIYRITPSELESLQTQFATVNQDGIWRSLLAFYVDMLRNNENTRDPRSRQLVIPEVKNAQAVILHAISQLSIIDESVLTALFNLTKWSIYAGHPQVEPYEILIPLLKDSPKLQAECYWLLGRTHGYWYAFDAARAAQDRALELHLSLDNPEGQARALTSIGAIHSSKDNMAEAESCYRQALALFQVSGQVIQQARTLKRIGKLHRRKDKFEEGIACFQNAASLHRQSHNKSGEGSALNQLGALYMQQERYDEAENALREALALHKLANTPQNEAHDLLRLSQVYQRRGQIEDAKSLVIESQQISRQQRDLPAEADALAALADIERGQNSPDTAFSMYVECVEMHKITHNVADQARMLSAISNIHEERKEFDLARATVTEGLVLQQSISNYYGQAEAYYQLGVIETSQCGATEYGENMFKKALELHKKIGDPTGELYDLRGLVALLYRKEDWEGAKQCLRQSIDLHRFISVTNQAYEFCLLGRVFARQGLQDEAECWFNRSIECYQQSEPSNTRCYGVDSKQGELWYYLSRVAFNQGNEYKATWMLKASRKFYERAQDTDGVQQAQNKLHQVHHSH